MRIRNGFEDFFVCALIWVMITQFLPEAQVWKRLWSLEVWSENGCGKSEIGSGFEEPGGSPPPRISRSIPPPPPRVNTLMVSWVSGHLMEVQVYGTHMAFRGWSAFKELPSDWIFLPPCKQSLSKPDLTEPRVLQLNQNKMTWFNLQLLKSCYIWEVHCKSCYASVVIELYVCFIDQKWG